MLISVARNPIPALKKPMFHRYVCLMLGILGSRREQELRKASKLSRFWPTWSSSLTTERSRCRVSLQVRVFGAGGGTKPLARLTFVEANVAQEGLLRAPFF